MSADCLKDRAPRIAVVGGGPAGLMAADVARASGMSVDLYERMGSVGRKFLLAGKGGLNLTHAEPFDRFVRRYAERQTEVGFWLTDFGADALRQWARGLGIETFVGSSGRVFPADMKAAPLLRAWVRRLRAQGVHFHVDHHCTGIEWWPADLLKLRFLSHGGTREASVNAVVLAMGGASWPVLGSDGAWMSWLAAHPLPLRPLRPSNCGFDLDWSPYFAQRFAGRPLKPVTLSYDFGSGQSPGIQGELMITAQGLEGGLIYAASAVLRDRIEQHGGAIIHLDLAPSKDLVTLRRDLGRPRGKRSWSEHLRRHAGIDDLRTALVHEVLTAELRSDAQHLAETIKALPLTLRRPRPIDEAISSAGGVSFAGLDSQLMAISRPGIFCAGEMLDWEAPTGGYLLTACLASGRHAGAGAVRWLQSSPAGLPPIQRDARGQ